MERAASTSDLKALVQKFNVKCVQQKKVSEALKCAMSAAQRDDVICVTGSLFTVGESRPFFRE